MNYNRAAQAYEAFHGEPPKYIDRSTLDDGAVTAYDAGKVVGIAYEAKRDGKTDQYFHKFRKGSRPTLSVRDDGKKLYLVDGKYHFTDRGIEDMAELFRVNPIKGKRKSVKAMASRRPRRRRSTGRRVSVYRPNPIARRPRRRRRASSHVTAYRRNPIARRASPRRRKTSHLRRYKRNPIGLTRGRGNLHIMPLILPAIMVGGGAVLAELAMGYAPIPANLKTGILRNGTKALIAVGMGMLVAKFVNRKFGEALAVGGITISAHDAIKDALIQFSPVPNLQFDEYVSPMGLGGIGFANPAPTLAGWSTPNYQAEMSEYVSVM